MNDEYVLIDGEIYKRVEVNTSLDDIFYKIDIGLSENDIKEYIYTIWRKYLNDC